MGTWYEIQRYEQEFQLSLDCVTAEYDLPNPEIAQISVHNRGVLLGVEPVAFDAVGVAVRSFPDDDTFAAKLSVAFFGQEPTRSNYWVLGTDYESFSLVWSCDERDDGTREESSWVLSRSKELTPEFWNSINLLLWANDINRADYRLTEQSQEICLFGGISPGSQ